MQYLIDSNIIIYYLNGDKNIASFIEEHIEESAISLVTYYEVLDYGFSAQEEKIVKGFLDRFEIIHISKNIIHQALTNRKLKKIKMADNFILATAQKFELNIVTRNTKDFSSFPVRIVNPFT